MFLVGHAVMIVSPTLRKDLLDLIVVEDDRKGDCLQFLELEGASAGGDMNMATASQHAPGHVKDSSHSAPESVNFILPRLACFQSWRYSLERYYAQIISRF